MSFVFAFIKLYPFFGVSMTVLCFDLSISLRRKGNKAWMGTLMMCGFFAAATVIWIYFRGDKNAELWYYNMERWLRSG